ncbi:MAG: hypothetical protein IJH64_02160 [Oscillospiraceae bacterium]|nr:hypothetical protein [Oscillospiraceae bacterium]
MDKGFYFIKDDFYNMVPRECFMDNKNEHRPHYFCYKDKDGLLWMIPLSSKVEKYEKIMHKRLDQGRPCDTIVIGEVISKTKSVFLIQNMFPTVPFFIGEEYKLHGIRVELKNENLIREINTKAGTVRNMMLRGIRFTASQPDIPTLRNFLLEYFPQND